MAWPKLEKFAIDTIQTDANRFLALLLFEMPSLRCLDLCDIHLTTSNWEAVLECIHLYVRLSEFHISPYYGLCYLGHIVTGSENLRFVRLNDVMAIKPSHKSFSECIEHYVVRGGSCPFVEDRDSYDTLSERAYTLIMSVINFDMAKRA